MNVVVLSHKRTKKVIENSVKKSRLITVVGYEGQIKASTAGHIYEYYKPHGVIVADDVACKEIGLLDFLSILKTRYPSMRIICACYSSNNNLVNDLYSIGIYDVLINPRSLDFDEIVIHPKNSSSIIENEDAMSKSDRADAEEIKYPARRLSNAEKVAIKPTPLQYETEQVSFIEENYASEKPNNIVISVSAVKHYQGCTYTALDFAFFLYKYETRSVCVISSASEALSEYLDTHGDDKAGFKDNVFINIDGVDIYDRIENVHKNYDYIVIDNSLEINDNAYINILLCSGAAWDMARLEDTLNNKLLPGKIECNLLFFPISAQRFVSINKTLLKSGWRAYRLDVSDDWQGNNKFNNAVYQNILNRYVAK